MRLRAVLVFLCIMMGGTLSAFSSGDRIEIRGKLLGYDGKPMAASYVYLHGSGIKSQKPSVDQDGRFSIVLEKEGGYWLWLSGVYHNTLLIPLLVDKPGTIDLTIRLATAQYLPTFDKILVIGDFNKFSTKTGGIPMERQADGTYAATVDSKAETISYQIYGVQTGDNPICGTQADSFDLDKETPLINNSSNQFDSVVKTGGHPTKIVFDPKKPPRSQAEPSVQFGDTSLHAARIVSIDRDIRKRMDRYRQARNDYVAAGNDAAKFQYDWSDDLHAFEKQIEIEQKPVIKQCLLLRYFDFPGSANNSAMARLVFKEVPPTSLIWSLVWAGPLNVFATISRSADVAGEKDAYRQQAFDANPDLEVRAAFLYDAILEAHSKGEADKVGRYYTRFMDEFGTTSYARSAREIAPDRNIIKDKPVPDFQLVSLDDASVITPEKLKDSIYLIDFWAVWCGPCVGEMKFLHDAYEKYKGAGLRILSISLDDNAEDVAKFRQSKWPMPWLNARLEDGFSGKVATSFELVGIPKPILIGKNGRIIAAPEELRGEKLLETLARVFNEK